MTSKKVSDKLRMVEVAAKDLKIHPTAQRQLIPSHFKYLKENLDLDKIQVISAVEYAINGVLAKYIVDGQHRWCTLMFHEFGDWLLQVALYYEVQTEAESCDLFLKLNRRAAIAQFDKFEARVRSGEQAAIQMLRMTSERQLRITRSNEADGTIRCISALDATYSVDGGLSLKKTLDTIMAAWGRKTGAYEGKIIEGLGKVYVANNGSIDQDVLVKKLAKYPGGASGLLGDAKGMHEQRHISVARCVAERVIETYNAGRRSGKIDLNLRPTSSVTPSSPDRRSGGTRVALS